MKRFIRFVACTTLVSTPYVFATSQTNHQNQPQHATATKPAAPVIVAKPAPAPQPSPYRQPTTGAGSTTAPYSPPSTPYRTPALPTPSYVAPITTIQANRQPATNTGSLSPPRSNITAQSSTGGTRAPVPATTPIKSTVSSSTVVDRSDPNRDNCVLYVRSQKTSLARGLTTYAEKSAKVTTQIPTVGVAAVHDMGNTYGHLSYVTGVNAGGNGSGASITLRESNYAGQTVSTRTGTGESLAAVMRALKITGFIN